MTFNLTTDILNIIKELDPISKVVITIVLAFATILGGFAAFHYFKNLPKQNKQQKEISSKIDHIRVSPRFLRTCTLRG
jgi:hypothetical protein